MTTQTVIKNPNDILRQKSLPIQDAVLRSKDIKVLIADMIETMKKEDGIGLAAPQIGKHLRLIIVQTNSGPTAFINPKIIARSEEMAKSEEGCLSVPGVYGIVERHKSVKIKAKDENGDPIRVKASGLEAVIFQHEIDHLDGILFIDKAEKIIKGESKSAI